MNQQHLFTNLRNYAATAKDTAEKLKADFFYPVPDEIADDTTGEFSEHLTTIANSYEYITFLVGILNDALGHIDSITDLLKDTSTEHDEEI